MWIILEMRRRFRMNTVFTFDSLPPKKKKTWMGAWPRWILQKNVPKANLRGNYGPPKKFPIFLCVFNGFLMVFIATASRKKDIRVSCLVSFVGAGTFMGGRISLGDAHFHFMYDSSKSVWKLIYRVFVWVFTPKTWTPFGLRGEISWIESIKDTPPFISRMILFV